MRPLPLLYTSLAMAAALAAWLIHATAPFPDATPANATPHATAVPERRAVAIAPAGPSAVFPPAPTFASPIPSVSTSSPIASSGAPSSPITLASLSPVDNSADESRTLPPLPTTDGSPPVPGRAVNSAAPGNFIRFGGMKVAVSGSYESGTPGEHALAVDISPEATSDSDGGQPGDSTTPSVASKSRPTAPDTAEQDDSVTVKDGKRNQRVAPTDQGGGKVHTTGMTSEDELFRMRWGWAAYDAAQREALKEAGK